MTSSSTVQSTETSIRCGAARATVGGSARHPLPDPPPGYYPTNRAAAVTGVELSREINKSWIGLATQSVFQCLLMKYLEIAASHTLVAGDMPEHARHIFGDDFVELSMNQSDEAIPSNPPDHLADKDRMAAMTDAAHRRVLHEHSTEAFADRTLALFRALLARQKKAHDAGRNLASLGRRLGMRLRRPARLSRRATLHVSGRAKVCY